MKTIAILALIIAGVTTAAAQNPQVDLEASYDGFDPSLLAEVGPSDSPTQHISAPGVTTKAGQRWTVEVIKQTLPPGNGEVVSAGITLDVTPIIQDGKIVLRGKSVVRHQLERGSDPSFSVINFTTRETFFNGPVGDGKPFTIHVDDGTTGKATITLTATLVPAAK